MLAESQIASAIDRMLSAIEVPPAPVRAILDRRVMALPAARRSARPYARAVLAAAATIALAFLVFPKASIALIDRMVVDGYAAAYRVMGWAPPPNPPKSLEHAGASEALSLSAARTKVPFTIVPPAGLPPDAVPAGIHTLPVLSYDKAERAWSKDSPALAFEYRRSDGRTFELILEKDDPRTGPPPRFMYEAEELTGGKIAMIKRAHYAWTNGKQMTSITADWVTPSEIEAIRVAMNGQSVRHDSTATIVKRYSLGP